MPERIAHVHLMRTAGTYVNSCLSASLGHRIPIRNSWAEGFGRDWLPEETRGFLQGQGPIYVHNHVASWTSELVAEFQNAGFGLFALVREPGDQLCSLFHWIEKRSRQPVELSLSEFIRLQLAGGRYRGIDLHHWAIPAWWEQLSYTDSIERRGWQARLADWMGHERQIDWSGQETNESANRGFEFHLLNGDIDEETHAILAESPFKARYESVIQRRIRNGGGAVKAEFVSAATNRALASGECDDAAFRSRLVERFRTIHVDVPCEHSHGESYLLADAILRCDVDGPVVECGCYKGGMTTKLSIVCKATGRQLVVCDSFCGLPTPATHGGVYEHFSSRDDVVKRVGPAARFAKGQYSATLQEVRENVGLHGELDVCQFVAGWFSDTLSGLEIRPSLVMIDVDLIESGRDCLRHFWPRLAGDSFFTHEAFVQTYMEGILDHNWWQSELKQDPPQVEGMATGLQATAGCLARLRK